jgi:ABC-type multidrug transport system fused ATPase/permease subunit
MALVIQTVSVVLVAFIMGLAIAWRLALVILAMQPFIIVACFYTRRVLLKSMSEKSMQVLGNMAFGSVQSRTSRMANFVSCVRSDLVRAMMI